MSAAWPPISCGGMVAVGAGRGCTITRPCSHWQVHTVVAGLRLDGLTAPAVFDGPIDTRTLPRVCRAGPGDRRCGRATLSSSTISRCTNIPRFAPPSKRPARTCASSRPYSPDFNPIEQAFAKLKAFLRAARPRSFDQVCELIAIAIGLYTPPNARTTCGTPGTASLHLYEKRSSATCQVSA